MISCSLNLRRISFPSVKCDLGHKFPGNAVTRRPHNLRPLRLHNWCAASLSTNSNNLPFEPSSASPTTFIASVGSPTSSLTQPLARNFTQRHIVVLNVIACAAGISATWLFCSAIPTLLAFKRAAESLEKLLDVTREELPGTMAAVRLSGMEISDLTMELSDLGQEITQGVKRSTRAVHLAEEGLRRFTTMNQSGLLLVYILKLHLGFTFTSVFAWLEAMQEVVQTKAEPAVGRAARGIRESIVKSRAFVQMFFSITRFSKLALKYLTSRAKSNA